MTVIPRQVLAFLTSFFKHIPSVPRRIHTHYITARLTYGLNAKTRIKNYN